VQVVVPPERRVECRQLSELVESGVSTTVTETEVEELESERVYRPLEEPAVQVAVKLCQALPSEGTRAPNVPPAPTIE
jgi:hypothetical protein